MDSRYLVLLFPFAAALCWGLLYAITERNLQYVSVPTNILAMCLSSLIGAALLAVFTRTPVDFTPYFTHPQRHWLWIAFVVVAVGTLCVQMSLKYVSATYTALIESFYIVLVPLFVWLLFGQKQWTLTTLVGAVLILTGIVLIVRDKAQQMGTPT